MAAPKFNIVRKNKKTGETEKVGCIWQQAGKGGGTFLSLQLFTEGNEKYKQAAFGKNDPATYFYNVYENTPKVREEAPERDEAWEEDEEAEDF